MMATFSLTGIGQMSRVFPAEGFSCWVKRRWSDPWRYVPYLFPESSIEAAWPADSEATLSWDYGVYARLWNRRAAFLIPINIENWYVAITTHTVYGNFISWIGVAVSQHLEEEGAHEATRLPSGVQTLQCKGLEYLLDRRIINKTVVAGAGESVVLNNVRPFNRQNSVGQSLRGNRSAGLGPENTWRFSSEGRVWTNQQIASYLLTYFQPNEPTFLITGQIASLMRIRQEWNFSGMTVRDALKELISRKRGLGCKLRTDGVGPVYLEIFSIAQYPVFGGHLPANTQQIVVDTSNDPHIRMELEINSMNTYDEIVVESQETIKTTWTFGVLGGTLAPGWTEQEEATYAGGTDEARGSDKLSRVFSYFYVPHASIGNALTPAVDNWGRIRLGATGGAWHQDQAFLRWLPWLEQSGLPDTDPDFREPFALIQNPETEGYMYVDRLELHDFPHGSMRLSDRELAIQILSRANHVFALDHFEGEGKEDAVLNYLTLLATLNMPTDQRLRVTLPVINTGAGGFTGRQLYIELPGVEGWVVGPNTVYDVNADGTLAYWNGGVPQIVRDDSYVLRRAAVLAWVWYGQQRAAATFTIQNQLPWFGVGNLILGAVSGLGAERIGTVVTSIERLYQDGEQVVTTGWGELDPTAFTGM